jgi:hypothetical protein
MDETLAARARASILQALTLDVGPSVARFSADVDLTGSYARLSDQRKG